MGFRAAGLLTAALLALGLLGPGLLVGLEPQTTPGSDPSATHNLATQGVGPRVLEAVRITGDPPRIDGDLSDPVWAAAPVAHGFVQLEPREGAPASERTEARVLYDDQALYVAVRAWDSSPDSIVAQLTRRDQPSYSDRVHVVVDSYFDRRTAFHFAVNPAGVKYDAYRYDDHREDPGWDGVWEVATRVDAHGWTAEFRIPLSQLRFSGAAEQDWGINFGRDIARRNETSSWAPLSITEPAMVSRAGILQGLRDLSPPTRIEVLPYSVARLDRIAGADENPFRSPTEGSMEVGADLRVGLTSNLTLDLTLNPDFGQVEADPAQVNLSAFETFLPERRPFFQEGAGICRFGIGIGDGDGENHSLFYSRRIGRAPQGPNPGGAAWTDRPDRTRILAAGKLSGKTESGWSLGLLGASTGEAAARGWVDGEVHSVSVEPRSHYGVARVQRDFRGGESALGVIATTAVRESGAADLLRLHREAVTGGVDVRHRFREGAVEIHGSLLGSRVSGTPDALARTQQGSARYFQRPDAEHVRFDPTATSLAGWSGKVELLKMGGGPWRFASLTHFRSPGFEANDLGFMPRADYVAQVGYLGYLQAHPGERLRRWSLNSNVWSQWDFGGTRQEVAGNVNGQITTHGNRTFFAGVRGSGEGFSPTLLRGGPGLVTEPSLGGWAGFGSDARQTLQVNLNTNWEVRPAGDSRTLSTTGTLRWRPSTRATFRVGPTFSRRIDDRQWVGRAAVQGTGDPGDPRHVEAILGRLEQSTLALTLRAETALTPDLSLQFHAQPFVSTGRYTGFRRVGEPRGERYEDRIVPIPWETEEGRVYLTLPNGSAAMDEPGFRSLQFRSNAVLRWEFRPGSTLYAVWSQSRLGVDGQEGLKPARGMDDLFSIRPDNVLMLKISYWFNP